MSIYIKLNQARSKFHELKLKKTGRNNFAGYDYFELGDFLIPALKVFSEVGICAIVSFDKETASMTLVDTDKDSERIVITSPMGSAALKGCHEVQNIGAVETYQRRYLWVAALEIVEHDALDASTGKGTVKHTPTDGAIVNPDRQGVIASCAAAINDRFDADDLIGAYEEYSGITDAEEKMALWKLLPSHVRSALKKHGESLKGQA